MLKLSNVISCKKYLLKSLINLIKIKRNNVNKVKKIKRLLK